MKLIVSRKFKHKIDRCVRYVDIVIFVKNLIEFLLIERSGTEPQPLGVGVSE